MLRRSGFSASRSRPSYRLTKGSQDGLDAQVHQELQLVSWEQVRHRLVHAVAIAVIDGVRVCLDRVDECLDVTALLRQEPLVSRGSVTHMHGDVAR